MIWTREPRISRNDKKRERQILHNYMEFMAANYIEMEPAEWADSTTKIYDSLNRTNNIVIFYAFLAMLFNLVIGICILVIKFFRRNI